ncbi:MAG: hypothetical protein AAB890_01145 [Patescibacteria group bacterium]
MSIFSVIIFGALSLVISVGFYLRSLSEIKVSLGEVESKKALAMANLCAESALLKLESVINYSGNETLVVDGKSCDILAVGGSGNLSRVVKTQSTVSGYTKKIKVEVLQISPAMQISSWETVPDF